ncbi:tetratricopeptide repeat protein [Neolewinella persica]|uniref:tetratricopeptide repeat protein n=1 Tax=Neolewinella persica TaxID=70998 RepID=UPI00146B52D5|nr:tetratricopeptide repeat protein [Neolewinella persica]
MLIYPKNIFIAFLFFVSSLLAGQADFRAHYERNNPAPPDSGLPTEERLLVHKEWLKKAEVDKDTLRQIIGEIYLYYDYFRLLDIPTATTHLLIAENLAEASGEIGWRGGVAYRRGHLNVKLRENDAAIAAYQNAVSWCSEAGDSLCVAESLEQISAMYGLKDSFNIARQYFDRALPMLRKFGTKKQLKTANANFGTLLTQEGKPDEAIPFLEEAKAISEELGELMSQGSVMNNLANAYLLAGQTDLAIKKFKEAAQFNKKHNFQHILFRNYAGLRESYEAAGNYRTAMEYQEKFHSLRDSLIGDETKLKIAALEAKYKESQFALELKESEQKALIAKKKLERMILVFAIMLLLVLIALWRWRLQKKQLHSEIKNNRQNLQVVARLLAEKNEALAAIKVAKIETPSSPTENTADDPKSNLAKEEERLNLFDHSILTNTDWTDFKVLFDKSNPGYLQEIREAFPTITESEERLFTLIKLNLKSKEISNLLGISVNSVKKTRNRLRKKLPLNAEDGLEDFIHQFKPKKGTLPGKPRV